MAFVVSFHSPKTLFSSKCVEFKSPNDIRTGRYVSFGDVNHRSLSLCYQKPRRINNFERNGLEKDSGPREAAQGEHEVDLGVRTALSLLRFYKNKQGEISPLLPSSCRYVPTCSEYSMEAYKKYGVMKGTILTAWRICRCNPLGGSGFDPPRWFGEESSSED